MVIWQSAALSSTTQLVMLHSAESALTLSSPSILCITLYPGYIRDRAAPAAVAEKNYATTTYQL